MTELESNNMKGREADMWHGVSDHNQPREEASGNIIDFYSR